MCLIALRDNVGSHIPNDVIEYNRVHNPDGFGLAWRENGKLWYKKFGPTEWDGFHTLLKKVDKKPVVYAAHWRFATHGAPCAELSHPYEYTDKDGKANLLFHNGVIAIGTEKGESDTLSFVKHVVSRLSHYWWKDSAIKWAIENAIGWSRVLIMTAKDDVILNDSSWKRVNGIKYSTTPMVEPPKFVTKENINPPFRLAPGVILPEEDEDEAKVADGIMSHQGHPIELTREGAEKETALSAGEEYGIARCLLCDAEGSYITYDKTTYVDLQHTLVTSCEVCGESSCECEYDKEWYK